MRISDWSSDVCSSDLVEAHGPFARLGPRDRDLPPRLLRPPAAPVRRNVGKGPGLPQGILGELGSCRPDRARQRAGDRSEEHTSELQSLMRTSYAVFCLKQKSSDTIVAAQRNDEQITATPTSEVFS